MTTTSSNSSRTQNRNRNGTSIRTTIISPTKIILFLSFVLFVLYLKITFHLLTISTISSTSDQNQNHHQNHHQNQNYDKYNDFNTAMTTTTGRINDIQNKQRKQEKEGDEDNENEYDNKGNQKQKQKDDDNNNNKINNNPNHTTRAKSDNNTDDSKTDDSTAYNNFYTNIWPPLQKSMCGKGYPNLIIGRSLFEYARNEVFGSNEVINNNLNNNLNNLNNNLNLSDDIDNDIDNDDISFSSNKLSEQGNNEYGNFSDTLFKFYAGGDFGTTIYEDTNKLNLNIMYIPIWKCANRQIRTMLLLLANKLSSTTNYVTNVTNYANVTNEIVIQSTNININTRTNTGYIGVGGSLQDNADFNRQPLLRFAMVQNKKQKQNYINNNNNNDNNNNENSNSDQYLKYIRYANVTTVDDESNNNNKNKKNSNSKSNSKSKIIPSIPCIFTVIRDPIEHFLSGYNEVEYRIHYQKLGNSTIKFPPYHYNIPWYPLNNISLLNNNNSNSESEESDIAAFEQNNIKRFQLFIENLLQENINFSIQNAHKHYFSISMILFPIAAYKYKLTGYIPDIKNILHTLPKFIIQKCGNGNGQSQSNGDGQQEQEQRQQPLITEDELPDFKKTIHPSSSDPTGMYKASKHVFYDKSTNNKYARALCIIHAIDYSCWNDLPNGIPTLCKEVYSRIDFISMILSITNITTNITNTATTSTSMMQNYPSSISVMDLHNKISHSWV